MEKEKAGLLISLILVFSIRLLVVSMRRSVWHLLRRSFLIAFANLWQQMLHDNIVSKRMLRQIGRDLMIVIEPVRLLVD